MKRITIAALIIISGCSTTPKLSDTRALCSDGFAVLTFSPSGQAIDQHANKALNWVARVVAHCEVSELVVLGLPEPSSENFASRQAAVILSETRSRRIPTPSFDISDVENQNQPKLIFKARPKT